MWSAIFCLLQGSTPVCDKLVNVVRASISKLCTNTRYVDVLDIWNQVNDTIKYIGISWAYMKKEDRSMYRTNQFINNKDTEEILLSDRRSS